MGIQTKRLLVLTFIGALLVPVTASATWSIVIFDRTTNRIGVAGASCTGDVYGIMGLRPGKGVIIAQAISNPASIQLGMKLLDEGVSADSIWRVVGDTAFDRELSI